MAMALWIGLALMTVGLLAAAYGGRSHRFGSFRGNYAENVRHDVTQTYTGTVPPVPPDKSGDGQDRFIKWAGLLIAFAGLIVSAVKLLAG
jgi:hypothetical protein